ncbi:MAG TPA: hypothetical protein IAC63_03640 [Candidatus Enterousia avicola]|uniref:Cell division protein FtsX n=1 Tax=Candidatus Enterousia avicola TaxID=2840787 RepID=A0A9D1MSU4_9PROT|nr:hypothetical protein [Candidatus Enterousia avicola]
MTKKPIVFSLVQEQSIFMTAIMSLLTFLAVLAFGIALSIGTGVMRWNTQWDLFATVQVMNSDEVSAVKKIIDTNEEKIIVVNEITTDQMKDLLGPWISGGGALENYLPKMYELQFKTKEDLKNVQKQISDHARFLTHSEALKSSTSAGWKMILISTFVLLLTLGAIGICISYIARNTALLHKRELEILNQIGATDAYVAHQMQIIIAKICTLAGLIGFLVAAPFLLLIISAAHSARVGLMAMLSISGWGWLVLMLLPVVIVIFAIWMTKRTTINILKNN